MNATLQRLLAATILGPALPVQAVTLTTTSNAPVPRPNDGYNFPDAPNEDANVSDGASSADGAANDTLIYVAGEFGFRSTTGNVFHEIPRNNLNVGRLITT